MTERARLMKIGWDTVMSRVLARWSFPVTMVVLTGIGIVAMQRGYSPLAMLTALSAASFLIVILLEQINPHSAYWEKPQGDVMTDLLHMVISGALIPPATGVVWRVLMAGSAASLSAGALSSDRHVRGLFNRNRSSGRAHGLFQHANTKADIGWLNWVFSMAELHRWHHSLEVEKANTNYGANLIWWDIVFGTRYLPKDQTHQPDDVGIGNLPDFPKGYLEQLAVPFRWRKTKEESAGQLQQTTS